MEKRASFSIGQPAISLGLIPAGISQWISKTMLSSNIQPGAGPELPTKQRIMIVDDEKDVSTTFKSGLERRNFAVEVFNDPLKALDKYEAGKYDLLLLDV